MLFRSIGAVHSVVFGGFASKELATRIDDSGAKVVVSASCGIEVNRIIEYKPLLDAAIDMTENPPEHTVVYQRSMATAVMQPGRRSEERRGGKECRSRGSADH